MNEIDKIILDSYQYLSSLGVGRFVYSGGYGLYLNGIDLGRELKDLDIKFLDLSPIEVHSLSVDFDPKIDKLPMILDPEEERWEEKDWNGIKVLVSTPESIILAKRKSLNFLSDPKTLMTETRESQKEKILRDLEYLKEHYEL